MADQATCPNCSCEFEIEREITTPPSLASLLDIGRTPPERKYTKNGRDRPLSYDEIVLMRKRYSEALNGGQKVAYGSGFFESLAADFNISVGYAKKICYRKDGT